jgi:regulator of sirC expression with transglutaminase-like and TPR domain
LQPEQPVAHFHEAATSWRALPQRPAISDAVRVQRMLAEDAIKQGQPYMALYYYEVGLEKDPLWPEGYFNAALVAASVEVYAQAAEHMERYLELLPNAPDAQTARDQIAMWQIKAKEQ